MTPAYILTDQTLTVLYEGILLVTDSSQKHWDTAREALRTRNYDELIRLLKPAEALRVAIEDVPEFSIHDDRVYWGDTVLHGALAERMLQMAEEGFDFEPLVLFLQNLMQNPSYRAREQLYSFLESNSLPITTDGCFMAYKRIRSDHTDVFSGKISNRIGEVVRMDRAMVDDDPTRTCSAGLHVASLPYLKEYSGERLVAVKVNPKDVVAVPTDYQNTKMRVCAYTVTQELPIDLVGGTKDAWDRAVVGYESDTDDLDEHYDEDDEDDDDIYGGGA